MMTGGPMRGGGRRHCSRWCRRRRPSLVANARGPRLPGPQWRVVVSAPLPGVGTTPNGDAHRVPPPPLFSSSPHTQVGTSVGLNKGAHPAAATGCV